MPTGVEFVDRIEALAAGTLNLLQRVVLTLCDALARPRRVGSAIRAGTASERYVPPNTFLVLTGFGAVKVIRVFFAISALVAAMRANGCAADLEDSYQPLDFSGELWRVPGVTELLLVGLAVVLASVLIARLFAWIVTADSTARRSLATLVYFYIGLALLLCTGGMFVAAMLLSDPYTYPAVGAPALWTAAGLAMSAHTALAAKGRRIFATSGRRALVYMAAPSAAAVALSLATAVGLGFVANRVSPLWKSVPTLKAFQIEAPTAGPSSHATAVITNNTAAPLTLLADDAEYVSADGTEYHGTVESGHVSYGVLVLAPHDVETLRFVLNATATGRQLAAGSTGRIHFKGIDETGQRSDVIVNFRGS